MNRRLSRQGGMTAISLMLMIVGAGFVIMIGLKLLPIYMEHFTVQTTLNNLKTEPELTDKTPSQILTLLQKRWDVNGVNRAAKDIVTFEKHPGSVKIQVSYEVEQPLVGNLSALVKFDNSIEIGEPN